MDVGDGVGLIMRGLEVRFLAQAVRGDELECGVAVVDEAKAGFTLGYRLTRPSDAKIVAEVWSEMVFFDYDRQRPVRRPAACALPSPQSDDVGSG